MAVLQAGSGCGADYDIGNCDPPIVALLCGFRKYAGQVVVELEIFCALICPIP